MAKSTPFRLGQRLGWSPWHLSGYTTGNQLISVVRRLFTRLQKHENYGPRSKYPPYAASGDCYLSSQYQRGELNG